MLVGPAGNFSPWKSRLKIKNETAFLWIGGRRPPDETAGIESKKHPRVSEQTRLRFQRNFILFSSKGNTFSNLIFLLVPFFRLPLLYGISRMRK